MDNPLVSVVMPFLNAEKFLRETVESVLSQTYINWELLLVDDGSTDTSTRIALHYAKSGNGKIRYLKHPSHMNRGTSASRNLAIKNAYGEYIALLDSDDIWLPNKLEKSVAILNSHPEVALTYEATQLWSSWAGNLRGLQPDYMQELGVKRNSIIVPPRLLPIFLRNEEAVPCTCSVLIRREAIELVGGFEESFHDMYDDQVLYTKICLAMPVFVGSGCLSKYRMRPDSCVSLNVKNRQVLSARLTLLRWVAHYLEEQKVSNSEVRKAIEVELWPYSHPILSMTLGFMHYLLGRIVNVHPYHRTKQFIRSRLLRRLPVSASVINFYVPRVHV